MDKTKQRKIYAYSTEVDVLQGDRVIAKKASPEFEDLLLYISIQPTDKKHYLMGDLTLRLEEVKKDDKYFLGHFLSTRLDVMTEVFDQVTHETRDNPKTENEAEVRKTFFLYRRKDGLFLLDHYGGNVAIHSRVGKYFEEKANEFKVDAIRNIAFAPILDKDFWNQINKYRTIRVASVELDVVKKSASDDAYSFLDERSSDMGGTYLNIEISKRHARNNGLSHNKVVSFLKDMMNRGNVNKLTIKGTRVDNGNTELRLNGMQENYVQKFPLDEYREVLSDPMLMFLREIAGARDLLP